MNDVGSIPQANKYPRLVITLTPTAQPGVNQVNVNFENLQGGWEQALALAIEGLRVVDNTRRQRQAQNDGDKKIIQIPRFIPPEDIGKG